MIQILKKDNAGMIEDLQFGSTNEIYVKNIDAKDFVVLDSLGNVVHEYELKSRRIKSNTYKTLMFGENKLRYVENKYEQYGGNYTFLWYCCFDKVLLGWDWCKGTTEYNLGIGQNKVRNEKPKKCVYVPTANMYEIEYVD